MNKLKIGLLVVAVLFALFLPLALQRAMVPTDVSNLVGWGLGIIFFIVALVI